MASSSMKSATKVNLLGKRGPQDDLETKPFLRRKKSKEKETTEGFADILQREEVAVRKKTLSFSNFDPKTEISDIINFFKNVEGVVRVQLAVDEEAKRKRQKHMGRGYIEFASANEAKKALQNKNGEYFCGCKILLDEAKYSSPKVMDYNILDHKFWPEDYYLGRESLPIGGDATFPDFVEDVAQRETTLFVANLSPQSKLPDIINFFNFYGGVTSVRLIVNREGKHVGYGFVEFSHHKYAMRVLEAMNGKYLHDHKIYIDLAPRFPLTPRPKYNLAEMLWYEDCLRGEILPLEEDEAPAYFVEDIAVRDKTLFVGHISPQTEISHIVDFFKDVGKVVHVRLFVNHKGKLLGYGFVEFASTNESKKALEKKNGKYFHERKIFLDLAKKHPYPPGLKYLEYLRQESLLIEEDKTMKRIFEKVTRREKTLFIKGLSLSAKKSNIINFFKDVGEVVHVEHSEEFQDVNLRYGLVEFASSTEAKKALEMKNGEYLHGENIFLDVYKEDPYPLRPMYKDYLRQESLLIEQDEENMTMERLVEEVAESKKTLFVSKLVLRTTIRDITRFFKRLGEIVRVRLIVDHMGESVGCCFVEFASVNAAKKVLRKMGMNLCGGNIILNAAKIAPYPLRPKYNLAEEIWYKDYLPQESHLMEEDDFPSDDLETKPKPKPKKQEEKVMDMFCGRKTTFSDE